MQAGINKLKDYVQVLKFIELHYSGIGNARPAISKGSQDIERV